VSYQKTVVIVINKKQYKETDLIITALSQNLGKISFIAKGANTSRSSRISSLQLGNTISIQLYQKRDIYWLSEVKTIKNFIKTSKNLNQLKFLFFYLELINRLIADHQLIDNVFQISQKAVYSIERGSLKSFVDSQIDLLNLLGFGIPKPVLTHQQNKSYLACQKLLIKHFESIIEKPLSTIKFT